MPTRIVWAVLILLVAIGVAAAIGRTMFPDDLITRFEPVREHLLAAQNRTDPFAGERPAELAKMDGRFAANRGLILVHVIAGGLFLLLAPLQFVAGIRARHIRVHRWSGRILLPLAIVTVLPALYFGILIPYGGPAEAAAIALFGVLFLVAIGRAYLAIRRGNVARHREWMIRVFAVAIGISTVRVVGALLDGVLTSAAVRPATVFVLSVWTGWVITVAAAEIWIRSSRPRTARPAPAALPAPARSA